jgi:GTP-binding protein LepA
MEIIRERLEREYNLALVATAPNVIYFITLKDGTRSEIEAPSHMPTPDAIDFIEEPFVKVTLLTPKEYVGTLMELSQERRGDYSIWSFSRLYELNLDMKFHWLKL